MRYASMLKVIAANTRLWLIAYGLNKVFKACKLR